MANDTAEPTNLITRHPEVARDLEALMQVCREELGDDSVGLTGTQRRPKGRVRHPAALTQFDPQHPYMIASYDGTAG